jgi:proteasome lid subunit RPN8/RPN11
LGNNPEVTHTLQIPATILAQLRSHAEQESPRECCGILLGNRGETGSRVVREAVACGNTHPVPQSSYSIAPSDLTSAQRMAREQGLEIIGFYHSHPSHPARPSNSDIAQAYWVDCSYLIIGGAPESADSYYCCGEQKLIPETLEIIR